MSATAEKVVQEPPGNVPQRLVRLRRWLREDLARAAELLGRASPRDAEAQLELVRMRSLDAVQDVLDLARGEHALRLNPRRRIDPHGFALQRARLEGAARQYRHLRTITRIVADASEDGPPLLRASAPS